MFRWRSVECVLWCALLLACSAHASVTNVYRVLRERGIPFDADAVSARAGDAVVLAVDPWGRVLSEGEVAEDVSVPVDVSGEQLPKGIGYVAVKGMGPGAGLRTGEYLAAWTGSGLQGVILDMRGARGVDLESVDIITSMVLGRTNELYTVQGAGTTVVERHHGAQVAALPHGFPVVLLVDELTRGSAELLAALLQGQGGVLVGGTRTRGDSGLREMVDLGDGRRLFIATRWLVPSGASYAGKGVKPDFVVDAAGASADSGMRREDALLLDDVHLSESERMAALMARRVAGDVVLKRAADVVLGMRALYEIDGDRAARGEAP